MREREGKRVYVCEKGGWRFYVFERGRESLCM